MISRAAAYHSGFNFGFNIAEAVNFALEDWIEIAKKANYCRCISDSVNINLEIFLKNLQDKKDPDPKTQIELSQQLSQRLKNLETQANAV